jgi:ubiquinone/menaquinone biosynthesis C-methylase UbiE
MIDSLPPPALAPGPGYDRVAACYDTWDWQSFWDRNEKPIVESILREMPMAARALDLGVGTGRYLQLFGDLAVPCAAGIDISSGMLAVARQRTGSALLLHADIGALPLAPNAVDLAIAARSLCHVPDLPGALRQVALVLRPGGTLIVTELDAEHAFDATTAPTRDGDVTIATWKRTAEETASAAACEGLICTRLVRVRATDCRWLPPPPELSSIDRSGRRAIFSVAVFSKRSN